MTFDEWFENDYPITAAAVNDETFLEWRATPAIVARLAQRAFEAGTTRAYEKGYKEGWAAAREAICLDSLRDEWTGT